MGGGGGRGKKSAVMKNEFFHPGLEKGSFTNGGGIGAKGHEKFAREKRDRKVFW